MKVKNTTTTYAGYDYQTLQGVLVLAEWLNSPTKYTKVSFDADDIDTPQGIDDIVCVRSDGKTDFTQVKFTPNADKESNQFTWDWLLTKTGKTDRSRCLIKKLSDAINSVDENAIGNVLLLTNKVPDREIEQCISGTRIDFSKIEPETQQRIISELGSQEQATNIFEKLEIQHSDANYQTLANRINEKLHQHSDDAGIHRLLNHAREWAIFEHSPSQDGWIEQQHIRELLSNKRPDPIPELFEVPDNYCLPDEGFHSDLIKRITNCSSSEVITITGKPGTGKSTFLSHLCQTLEENEIPLIRHHYFLAVGDTTADRLNPRIVAESLLHQIDTLHSEAEAHTSKPEDLRSAIETCSNFYSERNKPFVVLIDGLDHVWRDNAKNKAPLDETFRQLLPSVENMTLLVGTQPVDDELLPTLLLSQCPKDSWLEIPLMSGNAIYEYLKFQTGAKRVHLSCHEDHVENTLQESGRSLLEITHGYPLQVIYSVEKIAQSNKCLTSWEIEQLPQTSDGSIESYYGELWRTLTYKQKDALHLCSGFEFSWPRNAISSILHDDRSEQPSISAASHMLFEDALGVRPFHESLLVFVQNQADHQKRIDAIITDVCSWLEAKAPQQLKSAWFWSSVARSGNTKPLRDGLTRDWLLDQIISGLPIKTALRLFSEAETYAFSDKCFAEADTLRSLKTRLINGPEFQTWDSGNLEICTLYLYDDYAITQEISRQNERSADRLAILSIALWLRGDSENSQAAANKAIKRHRTETKLIDSRHNRSDEEHTKFIIKAGILNEVIDLNFIFQTGNFSEWPDGWISYLREAALVSANLDVLFQAHSALIESKNNHSAAFEEALIKLSILEDVEINQRKEFDTFSSKTSTFLTIFRSRNFLDINTQFPDSYIDLIPTEKYEPHDEWFFSALNTSLNASGDFSWLFHSAQTEEIDISSHLNHLTVFADEAANRLRAGEMLEFHIMLNMLPEGALLDEEHWKTRQKDILIKRDWIEIAATCHLITTGRPITLEEMSIATSNHNFSNEWFRLWYTKERLKLLDNDAAALLIATDKQRQHSNLEETIELSNGNLELARIAMQHNNTHLLQERLRKCWDFVLGYGHHKDRTIFDVLTAIEYLSDQKPEQALQLLSRLNPIISSITEFTDGDETRHAIHHYTSLLAKINPQTACSIYQDQIDKGEWYYSEETLTTLLKNSDLNYPIVASLFRTGLHEGCYQIIRDCIETGNERATLIAKDIKNLQGIDLTKPQQTQKTSSNNDKNIDIKFEDFPPNKIDGLITALEGEYGKSEFWQEWYQYWVEQEQEFELLEYVLPLVQNTSNKFDDKRALFDQLFISQKKLKGKTRAFPLLISAHCSMNAWGSWHEKPEKSIKRLDILAETYPNKIDEYIFSTTQHKDSWGDKLGELIIPCERLVYLFTRVERNDEAFALTEAMVSSLEESVRNLALITPTLDWNTDTSLEESLQSVLLARLKLPITAVKLWVIEEASKFLQQGNITLENLILNELDRRKLESECVEILTLFLTAKDKGYIAPNTLGNYIHARSTLSDMLIEDLLGNVTAYGDYGEGYSDSIDMSDENRFEHFQGAHVPLVYHTRLEHLENQYGFPFTLFYKSEWNKTVDHAPHCGTNIDYFFRSDRDRSTGQFYTNASHRGRSAFLRAIIQASRLTGMPDSFARDVAILALPLEPAYIGLVPNKPSWVPHWTPGNTISQDSINEFIQLTLTAFKTSNNEDDLAAFSTALQIDDNSWIDITLIRAITAGEIPDTLEIEGRCKGYSLGNQLDRLITYKSNKKEMTSDSVTCLTVTTFPLNRHGHWNSELESRGIYVPLSSVEGVEVTGTTSNTVFEFTALDHLIGHSGYWNENWMPVYPRGINSRCGSYTTLTKEHYSIWAAGYTEKTKHFYTCRAIHFHADGSYQGYSEDIFEFTIEHS